MIDHDVWVQTLNGDVCSRTNCMPVERAGDQARNRVGDLAEIWPPDRLSDRRSDRTSDMGLEVGSAVE
eukprot:15437354-Alexandrium_andersonii.AAC.1